MSLTVNHIRKTFPTPDGGLSVLRDCSFHLESGESLSIVGPSGSGKSTLLTILGTLEPADEGQVILDGEELLHRPEKELPQLRRRKLGFVFQHHHLLPQLTALENLLLPLLAEGRITKEQTQLAWSLLDQVGLADRAEHRPAALSGGERQRVAIARALIYQPALLLADEPTGNLDRQSAQKVGKLLLDLTRSKMLVMVTHDLELSQQASQCKELRNGKLY